MTITLSRCALPFALVTSLFVSAQAFSQSSTASNGGVSNEPRSGGSANTDLAEIVVTAQKRTERLQDVPVSVSAFSNTQLAARGVTTSSDLTQITPGLMVSFNTAYTQPVIRGVGNTAIVVGESGDVATYVDGIYQPQPAGAIFDLANVDSVEVLKGPQGTLFGRNTAGGAISINTAAPGPTESGSAELRYGNYNTVDFHGFLSGPISTTVGGSLSVNVNRHDNYFTDLLTGTRLDESETYGVRGALVFRPTDDLRITVRGDFNRLDDPTTNALTPQNGYLGVTPASPYPVGAYDYIGELRPQVIVKQYGFSVRGEYDIPSAELVSITGYRNSVTHALVSATGTPDAFVDITANELINFLSQEFQVVSKNTGPFRWIVGSFLAHQSSELPADIINGTVNISANVVDKELAVYANGTYTIDNFEFTLGGRGDREAKFYDAALNGMTLVDNASHSWGSFTPRAIIAYHPNRDLMAYLSYSQGFKSGVYNATAFDPTPIDPEKVHAYEIGVKSQPTSWLTANTSVYYYKRLGIQTESQNPISNLQQLENAGAGTSRGGELDFNIQPVKAFSTQFGLAYLDAKYTSFPDAQVYVPFPVPAPGLSGSLGNQALSINASGQAIERSPRWTANASSSYQFDLSDGGSIVPSVNVFDTSSFYWTVGQRSKQAGYALINAQILWHLPNNHFTVGLWGKNLGDREYLRSLFSNNFDDVGVTGDPRTYGLSFRTTF
jgi:iron complex outermembrane receptor protein